MINVHLHVHHVLGMPHTVHHAYQINNYLVIFVALLINMFRATSVLHVVLPVHLVVEMQIIVFHAIIMFR